MKINMQQANQIKEIIDYVYESQGIEQYITYYYLIGKLKASINIDLELESFKNSKDSKVFINAVQSKKQFLDGACKCTLRNG